MAAAADPALRRRADVVGTYDASAFQLDLDGRGFASPFPVFGFLTHPHVGVYGDDYSPTAPLVSIRLPAHGAPLEALPVHVARGVAAAADVDLDCWFVVHGNPPLSPCQKFTCERVDEFSFMFHAWLFSGLTEDAFMAGHAQLTEQVDAALYGAEGLLPAHLELKDGGMPFDGPDDRTVCIHEQCFSPANCMVRRAPGARLAAACSLVVQRCCAGPAPGCRRGALTLHIAALTDDAEAALREAVAGAGSLDELIAALRAAVAALAERDTPVAQATRLLDTLQRVRLERAPTGDDGAAAAPSAEDELAG